MKKYWAIALHNGWTGAVAGAFAATLLSVAAPSAWAQDGVKPAPATAAAAIRVGGAAEIDGFERVRAPAEAGSGVESLSALYRRPSGAGAVPVVVLMHGCGGLWTSKGDLGARERAWADLLVGKGYAVLFPDGFGSRGLGSQCRTGARSVKSWRERPADARAALRFLAARPDVDSRRIFLMGFSNGGSTVLSAVRPNAAPGGAADYRAAIAFYPGCRSAAENPRWNARIDTLILIGEADDWTPAAPCRDLVAAHADRLSIVTYPGAWHGFDHPSSPVRVRRGLAYTGSGTGEAHVGSDPAARADAIGRVEAWLTAHSR